MVAMEPFYVFIDVKSKSEWFDNTKVVSPTQSGLLKQDAQCHQISAVMRNESVESTVGNISRGSLPYMYIYLTTGVDKSFVGINATILSRNVTTDLLGPMWPLYRTARRLFGDAAKEGSV
jgi:hypothetical protein